MSETLRRRLEGRHNDNKKTDISGMRFDDVK
jgi:hypothetical protein